MPDTIVRLPDGTLVRLPPKDEPSFVEKGLTFGKSLWDDAARGLGNLTMEVLSPDERAMNFRDTPLQSPVRDFIKKTLPPKPEGDPAWREILRAGVESAGGGFALGPATRLNAGANFLGGTAGGAVAQLDTKVPHLDTAANMLVTALTMFLGGPKQSVAEADIRRALSGKTDADFAAAKALAADFKETGMKTATAAEAFGPNSEIMALARDTRGRVTTSANPLNTVVENRPEELSGLGQKIAETLSSRVVEPQVVANQAAGTADAIISSAERARANQYGVDAATGPTIGALDMRGYRAYMLNKAKTEPLPDVRKIYTKLADAFGTPKTGFVSDPTAVKDALKLSKEPAAEFGDAAQKAAWRSKYDSAYKEAVAFVTDRHGPDSGFPLAEAGFKDASANVVNPLKSGPLGRLAPPSLGEDTVTPFGRLSGVVNEFQSPKGLDDFLGSLEKQAGLAGPTPLINDIAKTLVQQKIKTGPFEPARALAGNPGSIADGQFASLLQAGGADVPKAQQLLRVSRALQDFKGPGGLADMPEMQKFQLLIRPFRTLDMMITRKTVQGIAEETGKLLADPANVPRLQEIARFDPTVRAVLVARGALNAASTAE